MTDFLRLDANVLNDVRLLDASESLPAERRSDALALYLAIWCLNRQSGQTGTVDHRHVKRAMLASVGWDAVRVEQAAAALETAGLIGGGTTLSIADWGPFWYCGKTDQERKAEERAGDRAGEKAVKSSAKQRKEPTKARHGPPRDIPVTAPPVTVESRAPVRTAVTSQTVRQSDSQTNLPPLALGPNGAPEREGGRKVEQGTPEQHLQAELQAAGVLTEAPADQRALAKRLSDDGCTSFDVEDLAKAARSQSNGNPAGLLTHWLRDSDWRAKLGPARGVTASIYGEAAPHPTPGDPSWVVDPASVGFVYCDTCGRQEQGKHWVGHGPIGWRPGDPIPTPGQKAAEQPPPKPHLLPKRPNTLDREPTQEERLAKLKAYAAKNARKESGA